jgi:hypothetical protein
MIAIPKATTHRQLGLGLYARYLLELHIHISPYLLNSLFKFVVVQCSLHAVPLNTEDLSQTAQSAVA